MVTAELSKDLDLVRRDIATLRDDVAALAASLKSVAAARGRETVGRIEDLGDRTLARAADLRQEAVREIGAHPFTSVLTSFGLGLVLGLVLDPKR